MISSVNEEKLRLVQEALKNIKRDFGKESVGFYGEFGDDLEIKRVSTGLISLDMALGGGLPRGDYIEIYGKPSTGKSTLCLAITNQFQKKGDIVAYIDVEQDFDAQWASTNFVDVDNLIISQPDTLEQALSIAEGLIKSGGVGLIIIDSMASLSPEEVIKKPMDQDTMGIRPKKLAQFFDKTKHIVKKSGTVVLFTNQWRDSLNMFGRGDSPGGWAAKHNFGIRMEVERKGKATDAVIVNGQIVAYYSHVTVVKNKTAAPFKQADFRIDFATGINYEFDLLEHALQFGFVEKSGAWYKYQGETVAQGENNMLQLLRDDPVLFSELDKKIRDMLGLTQEEGGETTEQLDAVADKSESDTVADE